MDTVYKESSVNLACNTNAWATDLGVSFLVTIHCDYFISYANGDYGNTQMRNEGATEIVGIENICLEANVGCRLLLKNVRHEYDIHFNLIFMGKLDNNHNFNQFGEGKWKLTKVLAKEGEHSLCDKSQDQERRCECGCKTF